MATNIAGAIQAHRASVPQQARQAIDDNRTVRVQYVRNASKWGVFAKVVAVIVFPVAIVAAMRGHGAMVELLLLSGLEADALDGNGLSARSAARMEGREEVLAVIDGVDRLKREASS
jgi:hypothetical protein